MNNYYKAAGTVAAIALFAAPAFAENETAKTCAAELSPTGKAIYDAVAPSVEAESDLKKLLKKKVRPLVMGGKLKRKDAKENAPLAGKCLHLLQQEKAKH